MIFQVSRSFSRTKQLTSLQRLSTAFSEEPRIGTKILRAGSPPLLFTQAEFKIHQAKLRSLFAAHAIEIKAIDNGREEDFRAALAAEVVTKGKVITIFDSLSAEWLKDREVTESFENPIDLAKLSEGLVEAAIAKKVSDEKLNETVPPVLAVVSDEPSDGQSVHSGSVDVLPREAVEEASSVMAASVSLSADDLKTFSEIAANEKPALDKPIAKKRGRKAKDAEHESA